MTDYTDLQKAAEYAAQDTIKFADEAEEMRALQQFHEEVEPQTVLALIAEKDAMVGLLKRFVDGEHDQNENQSERHMYFTEAQSLLALVSGELEAHTIFPDSAIKAIHAERDQLKAENETLRRERDARHPFKPFHEPAIGFTGCVICGVYTDHGGLPCPKTRAAAIALSMESQRLTPVERLRVPHPLEAAMGKGEQS